MVAVGLLQVKKGHWGKLSQISQGKLSVVAPYDQFIFLMHWSISITKVKSDGWLGDKNIKRMEFTQNLPPVRGGYVHKNNFFHVGGSKILVEMCWRSPCAHRADILLSGQQQRWNRYGSDTASK